MFRKNGLLDTYDSFPDPTIDLTILANKCALELTQNALFSPHNKSILPYLETISDS